MRAAITLLLALALLAALRVRPTPPKPNFTYYVKSAPPPPEEKHGQFHLLSEIGLESAVSDWAQREPSAAAAWALRQPDRTRLAAVSAVLIGVADEPEIGVKLARWFCAEDPTFVREHGATLITVLAARDRFATAVAFAELGGPERAAWMTLVFRQWMRRDPQAAAIAAHASDDTDALAAIETP